MREINDIAAGGGKSVVFEKDAPIYTYRDGRTLRLFSAQCGSR
jgi:hypothetical protein